MTTDIEEGVVKRIDGQFIFNGGMNMVAPAQSLVAGQCRHIKNYDFRFGKAEKSKGQRPAIELEIGAFYYDRFNSASLDLTKWTPFVGLGGAVEIEVVSDNRHQLKLTGPTTPAFDSVGVTSLTAIPTDIESYVELHVEHPNTNTARFAFTINGDNTALDKDAGLTIELRDDKNIFVIENGTATDSTINWDDNEEMIFRITQKQAKLEVYVAFPETNYGDGPTESLLVSTALSVPTPSFLQIQAHTEIWNIDKVMHHNGFSTRQTRHKAQGVYRFNRTGTVNPNETLVVAYGNLYKHTDDLGWITLFSNLDLEAEWEFETIQDKVYAVNNKDEMLKYDGSNANFVGAGATKPPIAKFIQAHLQSLFIFTDDSVFRNNPLSLDIWDPIEPTVDVDAWKGDVIEGVVKTGSGLYIIKTKSVWVLSGRTNATFTLDRLEGSKGCVAPKSIATDGIITFWRGADGIYRFDGNSTILISLAIHPMFNKSSASRFATTSFEKARESVGVLFDNIYRCGVVLNGESTIDNTNAEIVYDLLANGGNGGFGIRTNRNVQRYSHWDGEGDDNELFYIPSDTTNTFFQAEVENGNSQHKFENVSKRRFYDVDFVGEIWTKHFIAPIGRRELMTKSWQRLKIHFEPTGTFFMGVRYYTKNNIDGELLIFQPDSVDNVNDMDLDNTDLLDGTVLLASPDYLNFFRENLKSKEDKNKGTEIWLQITQDQTVRTERESQRVTAEALATNQEESDIAAETITGLRTGIGNFEHNVIRDITCNWTEENY